MPEQLNDLLWFIGGIIISAVVFFFKNGLPWVQLWLSGSATRAARKTIKGMLEDERWSLRTHDAISRRTAGIDDALRRQILTEIGALSFRTKEGQVLWGLPAKN